MMSQSDYLDFKGLFLNFVTGHPYSDDYRTLAADVWSQLPVYSDRSKLREILTSLMSNSVTVVISATGSGKSVIVPRLAMRYLLAGNADARLAMTFPKSVLAQESAKFAAATWDVVLGEDVGYQFRGSPANSHRSDTRALFLTDGTLFTMSRRDPLFKRFDLVIIDEAHERSVQTDLLLQRLRLALIARPTLRLVIMSATIDPMVFLDYFGQLPTAVVSVAGQPMFKINHHWESHPVSADRFLAVALERAVQALQASQKRGKKLVTDVLVFVPTTKDATRGCKLLKDSNFPVRGTTLCEGLYRKLPNDIKDVVIHGRPVYPMRSKLVFATPIAESSITLKSLAAVIDSGLQLSSTWLPLEQSTRVTRDMTSRAQIAQRIGRVGRVAPGVAYHVYSEAQYKMLKEFPDPAILQTDLTEHFLAEMCAGKLLSGVLDECSQLITPPSRDQTAAVENTIRQLGLIDMLTGGVSLLGRSIQRLCEMFKTSLSGSMLLMAGALVECRDDAMILTCILEEVKGQVADLWALSVLDPRVPLTAYCDSNSDHISLVRIYKEAYLLRESSSNGKSPLYIDMWDKIHFRILKDLPRYTNFLPRVDVTDPQFAAVAPPVISSFISFSVPLLRAVAFARRHRQLVFGKKDKQIGSGSSAGPLKSCTCLARPLLATNVSPPVTCVGGLYEELIEIGGKPSFSLISWICIR